MFSKLLLIYLMSIMMLLSMVAGLPQKQLTLHRQEYIFLLTPGLNTLTAVAAFHIGLRKIIGGK